jgi:GNAT superfamily N-acetyltransferase
VCAQKIHQQVSSGSSPTAFKHLRQYFNEKRAVDPTTNFHVRRDALLDPLQVETLRGAVGWDLMSGKYQLILPKSYAHFSVHADSQLVGFVNVISDGSADAFLVDLMVHPDFQGHGLGYALVRCATQALITDGIRCVEVIFKSHLEKFYRQCGFYIMKSGIIDSGG